MDKLPEIKQSIRASSDIKFRLEYYLNELISEGILTERDLFIEPTYGSLYNVTDDFQLSESEKGLLKVTTPQPGFYDRLPEHLFYKAVRAIADDEESQRVREQEKKQKKEAQQFFLPFDSRLYRQRVTIEQWENDVLSGQSSWFLTRLVKLLWDDNCPIETLTVHQLNKLVQLLLSVHQVAGNLTQCEHYMTALLELPVQLQLKWRAVNALQCMDDSFLYLSTSSLGVNSVLLGTEENEQYPHIEVQVNQIPFELLSSYFPGEPRHRFLEILCDLLLPIEADYTIHIDPRPNEKTWLGSEDQALGRLGYTTLLNYSL